MMGDDIIIRFYIAPKTFTLKHTHRNTVNFLLWIGIPRHTHLIFYKVNTPQKEKRE